MKAARWLEEWENGVDFQMFLDGVEKNEELWKALYRRARPSDEVAARAAALGAYRLLVIADDWCGDAVNTIPVIARLVDRVESLQMRVVGREDYPELMQAHLTGTARSIPVVIALDEESRELAWWGPRPEALQSWVLNVGLGLTREERYRQVRTWYARDRGATTLAELLAMLEEAAAARVV